MFPTCLMIWSLWLLYNTDSRSQTLLCWAQKYKNTTQVVINRNCPCNFWQIFSHNEWTDKVCVQYTAYTVYILACLFIFKYVNDLKEHRLPHRKQRLIKKTRFLPPPFMLCTHWRSSATFLNNHLTHKGLSHYLPLLFLSRECFSILHVYLQLLLMVK